MTETHTPATLPQTLGELPTDAARRWPSNEALAFEDRSWTYSELCGEVEKVAASLVALGVESGDKVALWITNRPEYLFAFFAILRVGAVVVPLNTRWRTRDLLFALQHCEASVLLSETSAGPIDFEQMVREAVGERRTAVNGSLASENCPSLRRVVFLGAHQLAGALSWDEFARLGESIPADAVDRRGRHVARNDLALLAYTSGTTGTPKAVMLSHAGIVPSFHRAMALGMSPESVQINYLPLFHIYGLIFAVLPSILTGAKQVLMHKFDADEALRLVAEHRGTVLHGFDTHYKELLAAQASAAPPYDISSLRWSTFAAGAETAHAVAMKVQQSLCRTISTYGQSETWGAIFSGPFGCTVEQSCCASGSALPGVELRIVDPLTRVDVPKGAVGEILIRCESVMLGYYRAEEETRAAIDEAGWMRTGDAGFLRPDGHLCFIGRYKDMLKVGGENVDPAEVEALLLESPLIDKVAIVGCPDERLSEVVAAFIVPVPGAETDQVRRQIDLLCRGRIASFKIPRRIEFIAEMPTNAAGKVDKKILRLELAQPGLHVGVA